MIKGIFQILFNFIY